MLDRAGDVGCLAVDAGIRERSVEKLPARTDKGLAREIFGCSPTSIKLAWAGPSPGTTCVASL
jgi:hypothetical protein